MNMSESLGSVLSKMSSVRSKKGSGSRFNLLQSFKLISFSYIGNGIIETCFQILFSFINPSFLKITTELIGSHDDILIMKKYYCCNATVGMLAVQGKNNNVPKNMIFFHFLNQFKKFEKIHVS